MIYLIVQSQTSGVTIKKLSFIFLFLFAANVLAQSVVDIDVDDDGLIEINHLEDLNAMRYQLDGSGLRANATAQKITTGCAVGGCKGYELTRDLDFFAAASYRNIANQKLWTTGAGWQPIGDAKHPFSSLFKTNNSSIPNTIFNLTINNSSASKVGLFGHINNTAEISGIGLLDVEVTGHHQVGGLVGESSGGQISNSYVSGRVVGYGGEVGLLVGRNSGAITNSFSDGEVSGEANGSGGLVGANSGAIANSYATGNVVGSANYVGGLVGDNSQGTISNCYTTGTVSGGEDIGGLVGISNLGTLINNYVSGKSSGTRYVGGLVGSNIGGTITHSYWDKTASEIESNTGGVGLSASELQSANAQAEDLNKPYYKWSESNWDFGTAEQYPVLKYAVGPNSDNPVCGAEQTLPNCGALLLGQHASLSRIVFLEDIALTPTFKPTQLNYHLNITADIKQLQLIPVASKPDSTIKVSKNGIAIDNTLASGTTSSVITLTQNTEITIEVSATNQRPAQYRLAINYIPTVAITGVPTTAIDEGRTITLDATKSRDTEGDTLTYRWTQTIGKTLSIAENDQATLSFKIPEDYVAATAANDPLGFTLTISDGKATIAQDINLTINKIDNGSSPIGTPTLNILEWTAPEIDLSADPDGVGNNLRYQWQSRSPDPDADWADIDKATKPTHALSFLTMALSLLTISDTTYRVRISYTDGQGYETTRISEAAKYDTEIVTLNTAQAQAAEPETTPTATTPSITVSTVFQCSTDDIDQDNDGLIEICDLEGLNAIRYQMDGTGYRASAGATKITTGCKTGGCNGYELMRDLDFNDDASYSSISNKVIYTVADYKDSTDDGWQPIGYHTNEDDNEPFTSIFEGNGHTISNLMINRPNTNGRGLFGYTADNSKILNIGLLNVEIEANIRVGGLAGRNDGSITNSYAIGSVSGNTSVGGLVGLNKGSITNSYATGSVAGRNIYIGGLVGRNEGSITNSYATGSVEGKDDVGGLVGNNGDSIINNYAAVSVTGDSFVGGLVGFNGDSITNSYATGSVTGRARVGGLIGWNLGSITNNYATGSVHGNSAAGLVGYNSGGGNIMNNYATGSVIGKGRAGLVGRDFAGTTNSYWDTETSEVSTSNGGIGKTTDELQSPITATGIYSNWSTDNWDFGTASQYPILKDTNGDLLSPALRYGLSQLRLATGNFSPDFIAWIPNYTGTVVNSTSTIQLIPTAINPNASIRIESGEIHGEIASGAMSSKITLNTVGITTITIVVTDNGVTVKYNLQVNYYHFSDDIDKDDDGLIEIDNSEGLNAIRYQLDGTGYRKTNTSHKISAGCPANDCKGYELTTDLDLAKENNWLPINFFQGIFEGNDHTISNLKINRPDTNYVGLFGYVKRGSEINNVGLLNVDIEGNDYVGGLAGYGVKNSITNSYATGSVKGNDYVGGLAGLGLKSSITNNYATGSVKGNDHVGGLAGNGLKSSITNNYATGSVKGNDHVGGLAGHGWKSSITNNYATGSVDGNDYVGGLAGYGWKSSITNNYATGSVDGNSAVGGLVGDRTGGTITNSYWDTEASEISTSDGGIGKTTAELQSPTAATGIYDKWDTDNWDFGTSSQYPVLKYGTACDATRQPDCGKLLPNQYTLLDNLRVVSSNATLSPQFNPQTFNYRVAVNHNVNKVTVHTTATGASIRISNDTDTAGKEPPNRMDTASMEIPLTITSDTVVTIEVDKDNQRPTRYTLTVAYDIDTTPLVAEDSVDNCEGTEIPEDGTINEGCEFKLSFENVLCYKEDIECEWDGHSYLSPFVVAGKVKLDGNSLSFKVLPDALEAYQSSRSFIVTFATGSSEGIGRKETKLKIVKQNNGHIDLGQISSVGLTLTSPEIDPLTDTDRGVQTNTLSYQWQQYEATGWNDISGATTKTYTLAGDVLYTSRYRLQISYADGQDHETELYTDPISRDIDADDDGLIEIRYLEELDAIRYQLDGTGYKASAGAAEIKTGCKTGGCNGYELVRDLDFNDDASYSSIANKVIYTVDDYEDSTDKGWNPIVGTTESLESFSGTFRGNNHTIANLMINRETDDIGLFAKISDGAVIDGVDLYKVNIRGKYRVGALVSSNRGGTITNISIDGEVNGSGDYIGGLVGVNGPSSKIANSYSAANVRGVEKGMGKFVGGLVGTSLGKISDSYAMGNTTGNLYVGGLVGLHESGATTKSYAIAKVRGKAMVGGLIGHKRGGSDIQDSYWDTRASGISTSADGSSKTTVELQMPTMATGIYSKWSADNWDFGTTKQYPALKYNSDECAGDAAPDYCGDWLAGQRLGLQSLKLSDDAMLLDDFSNTTYRYDVLVGNKETSIRLTAIAANPKDEIRLYRESSGEPSVELAATTDSKVELAPGNSTMTIVVRDGRSEVSYTLNIMRIKVDFGLRIDRQVMPYNEGVTINEGSTIGLKSNFQEIVPSATYAYRWTQSQVKTLATTDPTKKQISLSIPKDFVARNTSSSDVVLNWEVTVNSGDKQIKSNVDVNLTIKKVDNGRVTRELEAPTLMGLTLTAATFPTQADIDAEPDGDINTNNILYQWQSSAPNTAEWDDIKDNANASSYEIPMATTNYTVYRVRIGYTDGQGYKYTKGQGYDDTLVSKSYSYIDIDRDDNGLIDIHTKEQLDAIRYQLDGTGYRTSASTEPITAGCATNDEGNEVCKGYELKAHIDLSPNATVGVGSYEKWQPIGDGENPFDTIFEGNGYTISNFKINKFGVDNVGLFAATAANAKIRNVGLLNVVQISGKNNIGSIVGFNKGTITNSYVIAKSIIGNSNIGGLVGKNEGSITNSYVIAKSIIGNSNIGGLVGNSTLSKVKGNYAKIDMIKSGDNESACFLVPPDTKQDADNKMIGDCENKKIFESSDQ